MKCFYSLLLSLLLFGKASAKDDSDIIQLVNKWNQIHNTHITGEFLKLYAPDVLFYGKNSTASQCYWLKEKFLNSDFRQDIISDIIITHYKSGIIKADFRKRTMSNKKTNEHVCYLLFKKIDGEYRITGESDTVTDAKKNVKLDLGEVDYGDSNTLLFVCITAVLGGGLYWRYKNKKQKQQSIFEYSSYYETKPAIKEDTDKSKTLDIVNKQKGDAFENFVVDRFKKPFFTLVQWRSDKIHNGTYAQSNMYPDLEYRFKSNFMECDFAVECKWRSSFIEGKIDLAKDYQLNNYRRFSAEKNIRVFVIIGIGGQPADPQSLYIIPLDEIKSIQLYQVDIVKYQRYSKSNFFFNIDSGLLE